MGILNPLVRDDIDVYASELLKREDPEPMQLLTMLLLGKSEE
jgi:hypothetical protein